MFTENVVVNAQCIIVNAGELKRMSSKKISQRNLNCVSGIESLV